MTSLLQPVDYSVARFFKAAFRRLLTQYILDYINGLDDDTAKKLSLRNSNPVYDGVLLMAKS